MINVPISKCLLAALSVLSCVDAVAPSTESTTPDVAFAVAFDATAKIDPEMRGGRALGTAPAPSLKQCKKNKDKNTCSKEEKKWVKRKCRGEKQNANICTKMCRKKNKRLSTECKEACCSSSPSPPPVATCHTFTSKDDLQDAVKEYDSDAAATTAKYGAIDGWCVSGVTDMSQLFYDPTYIFYHFNADISSWDTSRVTNMMGLFLNAYAFNQPLSWDTSSVTDMAYMFGNAYAFNQPLSWDTSRVTTMEAMFHYAYTFNQPLSWDTSSVTDMTYMFSDAIAFNQPLSWDTSGVTDMHDMFGRTRAFNQPLSWDTSRVMDMNSMFYRAIAFNQPLSWDTSSVTDMTNMFGDANSLSAANKLLIRCAWAGTPAFVSAGYGSSWAPGSCP